MKPLIICLLLASVALAQQTPIQHVVFIYKENRSFDHMFGTLPGVNGATTGRIHSGKVIPLGHSPDRALNYNHDWNSVSESLDDGHMDHFDLGACAPAPYKCYSQYHQNDISNYFAYAQNYLIADNFFSSLTGPSFPNHLYTIASQSGTAVNNPNNPIDWGCDSPSGTTVQTYDNVNPGTVYSNFGTFDSLLAFAEYNWDLNPLTQRDAQANNLVDAFNFSQRASAKILSMLSAPKLTRKRMNQINRQILHEYPK